jgi:hypothetical protein
MAAPSKRIANPFRPGTASYAKRREELLKQKERRALTTAARAKQPEVRQQAQRQASAARSAIKKIDRTEAYRQTLAPNSRASFDRLPLSKYPYGDDRLAIGRMSMPDAGLELELAIAQDRCRTRRLSCWVV